MRSAGASKNLAQRIVAEIMRHGRSGIRTEELRLLTATLLRSESARIAARYELRNAVLDLGPTGYWFENLIGALYESMGFRVEIGSILDGRCITHEVDVIATKRDRRVLVECKFRNGTGMRCDSKVALYVQARATDLKESPKGISFDQFLLVANTKFTSEAIRYASCVGLGLLGWDFPKGRGLQNLIEEHKLHPLTSLTTITHAEKRKLLRHGVITCRELPKATETMDQLGIDEERQRLIEEEVVEIVGDPTEDAPEDDATP